MKFGSMLLISLSVALPVLAMAEDVKINSFNMTASRGSTAEICGQVVAPTGHPQLIKLVIDPRTKTPGYYYVWSGSDGKFCAVVSTNSGQADAFLDK